MLSLEPNTPSQISPENSAVFSSVLQMLEMRLSLMAGQRLKREKERLLLSIPNSYALKNKPDNKELVYGIGLRVLWRQLSGTFLHLLLVIPAILMPWAS